MARLVLGAGVLISLIAVALRAQAPPQFAVAVEYVEMEARVLDEHDRPIRGLTKDQFQVIEDGAVQSVTAFSVIDLPAPAAPPRSLASAPAADPVRPDFSSNVRQSSESRIFLLLLDDEKIDQTRTLEVRRFLRDFLERSVGPDDRVAVSSLWRSTAFQNFTSDKALLVSAVNQVFGSKLPSPTVRSYTSLEARAALSPVGGPSPAPSQPVATGDVGYTTARAIEETLLKLIAWMGDARATSKSIILVSEGIPPDVTRPDDALAGLETQMRQFELDRLAAATRRSSVPIYTVDPRGLTSLAEESIQVGTVAALNNTTPLESLQKELELSRVGLRRLAEDTGGAFFATNDFQGAFDQVVDRASSYYLLGYHSTNAKHDGKFRRVQVKVDHPEAHVVARSGYMAPTDRPPRKAPSSGPPASSELVRDALNSKFPMNGLSLTMTAAPFREKDSTASVALVLEASGRELELTTRGGAFAPLQVLVAALDNRGAIRATDARDIQFNLPPAVFTRVENNGFRWLSRIALKPGQYQLRIAAAGPSKQGSVWYDLDVPDFSDGELSMSSLLITSAARFATPTLRPDPQLSSILPGPPTASREFPSDDELMVFAEVYDNRLSEGRDFEVMVRVRTDGGREVFRLSDPVARDRVRAAGGTVRSITKIPLHVLPGRYVVSVEAARRGDAEHRIIREVPITVVR